MSKEWFDTSEADPFDPGKPESSDIGDRIRFWIPQGAERKIIFASEVPVVFHEHQLKLRGSWRNWFTCIAPSGKSCPLCGYAEMTGKYKRYKAWAFLAIDTHEYTDKAGTIHKNEPRIFLAKRSTIDLIRRKKDKIAEKEGKTLQGAMFTVYRNNEDKSPAVGSDFTYEEHVDLAPYKEALDKLILKDLLMPSPERMKTVVDALKELERAAGSADEDDIPF